MAEVIPKPRGIARRVTSCNIAVPAAWSFSGMDFTRYCCKVVSNDVVYGAVRMEEKNLIIGECIPMLSMFQKRWGRLG